MNRRRIMIQVIHHNLPKYQLGNKGHVQESQKLAWKYTPIAHPSTASNLPRHDPTISGF